MTTSATTVWNRGRLDSRAGPKRILFGRTYEDPTIELEAFGSAGRVLCIASSGCTARQLAAHHDEVVAVDINPVQLAYARHRLAGGAGQLGTAERVMAALRFFLPLTGITRSKLEAFLAMDDVEAQAARWEALATRRFRFGVGALFSLVGLRAAYSRDLLDVLPRRFGRVLLSRLSRGFATHPNRDNPYAHALFLGAPLPADEPAPGRIELVCSDVASYLEDQPAGSFSGISLSNVLDGASREYRARLFEAAKHAATDEGVVVLRSFGEPENPGDAEMAARDQSLLWGSVRVAKAITAGDT